MLSFSSERLVFDPEKSARSVVAFFQDGVQQMGNAAAGLAQSVEDANETRKKYQSALERIAELERDREELLRLRTTIEDLQLTLQYSSLIPFKNIPARIIAKDPSNFFSSITINKGYLDGIQKNMPVVAIQGGSYGLVGKILETSDHSALIQPIHDRNLFVSARLAQSRYEGLISGSGDNSRPLVMQYIKKSAKSLIRFNDVVITSGVGALFPPGIPVGTVQTIYAKDYETSLELGLESIIDFSRLETVYILKKES